MPPFKAHTLGLDITTSELAVAVCDADGREDYVAMPMRGATHWRDDSAFPAFDLAEVPGMIGDLLDQLEEKGWNFETADGIQRTVSVACRQHDMVVLSRHGNPLLPAISWQCNAADQEVEELRKLGAEKTVGRIEPRFVLPKLQCVLKKQPELKEQISSVFMTGDWVAYELTGKRTLSSSDALSNGLLKQATRRRADTVLKRIGFSIGWFPSPVPSGSVVGTVRPAKRPNDLWARVKRRLHGWQFVAGLGDNHASAVGCGMSSDHTSLVVSAGTSGTVNFACPRTATIADGAQVLRFEFYADDLLLLLMLGDCGEWYKRFLAKCGIPSDQALGPLDKEAIGAEYTSVRRVLHSDAEHTETYPPQWEQAELKDKVAWTQFSIVLELLLLVKRMLHEASAAGAENIKQFILTGGLSQSQLFQHIFHAGISLLAPGREVMVSARTGPLRYKTSAFGALINAELPRYDGQLAGLHKSAKRFPLGKCAEAETKDHPTWRYLLRSYGI